MIVTTTQSVENHKVKEYLGIVSGTDIYLVGGAFGGGLSNQETLFSYALAKAKSNLVSAATAKGADAVIGVQTSFTSPGNVNNMILVLTGTAVKLEEAGFSDELPDL